MIRTTLNFILPAHVALLLLGFLMAGCGTVQKTHQPGRVELAEVNVPGRQAAIVLIRSSLGATAQSPVSSTWSGAKMIKNRLFVLIHGVSFGVGLNFESLADLPPQAGGPEFEAYLDRQGLPAITHGSVEFLIDGEAFFNELLREIENAKSQVDIQTYIFDNDPFAIRLADALKKNRGMFL